VRDRWPARAALQELASQLFQLQSQDEINAVAGAAEIPEIPAPGCLGC